MPRGGYDVTAAKQCRLRIPSPLTTHRSPFTPRFPVTSPPPLPEPLNHPAAWRGEELFAREDWRLEFEAADLQEIAETVAAGREGETDAELPPRLAARFLAGSELPGERLRRLLNPRAARRGIFY